MFTKFHGLKSFQLLKFNIYFSKKSRPTNSSALLKQLMHFLVQYFSFLPLSSIFFGVVKNLVMVVAKAMVIAIPSSFFSPHAWILIVIYVIIIWIANTQVISINQEGVVTWINYHGANHSCMKHCALGQMKLCGCGRYNYQEGRVRLRRPLWSSYSSWQV